MKLRLPRTNENGLALPPRQPDEPVPRQELRKWYGRVPFENSKHHIYWPEREYLRDTNPLFRKLRNHPINIVLLTAYQHQREHIEFDPTFDRKPHALKRQINRGVAADFLDEAEDFTRLHQAIAKAKDVTAKLEAEGCSGYDTDASKDKLTELLGFTIPSLFEVVDIRPTVIPIELHAVGIATLRAEVDGILATQVAA